MTQPRWIVFAVKPPVTDVDALVRAFRTAAVPVVRVELALRAPSGIVLETDDRAVAMAAIDVLANLGIAVAIGDRTTLGIQPVTRALDIRIQRDVLIATTPAGSSALQLSSARGVAAVKLTDQSRTVNKIYGGLQVTRESYMRTALVDVLFPDLRLRMDARDVKSFFTPLLQALHRPTVLWTPAARQLLTTNDHVAAGNPLDLDRQAMWLACMLAA